MDMYNTQSQPALRYTIRRWFHIAPHDATAAVLQRKFRQLRSGHHAYPAVRVQLPKKKVAEKPMVYGRYN